MTRQLQARRMNMQAFAQQGEPLAATTPLEDLERLRQETHGLQPGNLVSWKASPELRERSGSESEVWLHLDADASIPMTCQRCMQAVLVPVKVDQWYRFVSTEDVAMAEDDQSEEDLLVMEPQFDLMALVEDELLMALPLVPMHESCPVTPTMSAGEIDAPQDHAKPNPFAVLSELKKK
jgi:uncharacterized protein